MYFGTRTGEVWGSADSGASWQQITAHLPDVLCVRVAGAGWFVTPVTVEVPAAVAGGTAADGSMVDSRRSPTDPTVADVLAVLAVGPPAVERRIRDETGQVRRFVNLYVDGTDVRETGGAQTPVREGGELLVIPSVAGGWLTGVARARRGVTFHPSRYGRPEASTSRRMQPDPPLSGRDAALVGGWMPGSARGVPRVAGAEPAAEALPENT